jgi:hypothetical protein
LCRDTSKIVKRKGKGRKGKGRKGKGRKGKGRKGKGRKGKGRVSFFFFFFFLPDPGISLDRFDFPLNGRAIGDHFP